MNEMCLLRALGINYQPHDNNDINNEPKKNYSVDSSHTHTLLPEWLRLLLAKSPVLFEFWKKNP